MQYVFTYICFHVCSMYISSTKLYRVVHVETVPSLSIYLQTSPTHLQKGAISFHSAVSIRNVDERHVTGNRVLPQTSPIYLQHISAGVSTTDMRKWLQGIICCGVRNSISAQRVMQRVAACCSVLQCIAHVFFFVSGCVSTCAHVQTAKVEHLSHVCLYMH